MSTTRTSETVAPTRAQIRQFRDFLNAQDTDLGHQHNRFHQRTRKYGDYLYAQGRPVSTWIEDRILYVNPL